MSSNYAPSDQNGNFFQNAFFAAIVTVALFGFMPFMQFLENQSHSGPNIITADNSVQPPPPPPEDRPPPPKDEKEIDEPEMKEPPPPMSLSQLEMALNPGSGNAMGDFGFTDFGNDIDALEGMKIFDLSDVDRKPSVLVESKANYPYSMQKSKTRGFVVVQFVLDANGKVHRPRAIQSSHREFEQPAIEAVLRSTFNPASKGGKNVACRAKLRIKFSP